MEGEIRTVLPQLRNGFGHEVVDRKYSWRFLRMLRQIAFPLGLILLKTRTRFWGIWDIEELRIVTRKVVDSVIAREIRKMLFRVTARDR